MRGRRSRSLKTVEERQGHRGQRSTVKALEAEAPMRSRRADNVAKVGRNRWRRGSTSVLRARPSARPPAGRGARRLRSTSRPQSWTTKADSLGHADGAYRTFPVVYLLAAWAIAKTSCRNASSCDAASAAEGGGARRRLAVPGREREGQCVSHEPVGPRVAAAPPIREWAVDLPPKAASRRRCPLPQAGVRGSSGPTPAPIRQGRA